MKDLQTFLHPPTYFGLSVSFHVILSHASFNPIIATLFENLINLRSLNSTKVAISAVFFLRLCKTANVSLNKITHHHLITMHTSQLSSNKNHSIYRDGYEINSSLLISQTHKAKE
jgi:hypothetical protein